jgi:PHD/YefM family antitoxin component YafN of YafNO toxin-antitoxin module
MIFYKGFTIIEHSEENEDEDDSGFKIIAFSENKSELEPVLKSLEEKQKQKSLLNQEAANFVRLYENDWKKEICPRSKEDHERIRLSKLSSEARTEHDKVISEKKKIFTKTWIENNPIPKNIARLIEIDDDSINRRYFFEIWYEIKKVS